MHPFFRRPAQLISFVGSWLGLSVLASFAISFPDGSFFGTALVIVPSCVAFSFVSLSAWNLCRAYPLRDTQPVILIISILSSSVLTGSVFIVFIAGLSKLMGAPAGGDTAAEGTTFHVAPLISFTSGVALYLLSVLFHYLLIANENSREAERRSLEAEIHARSSELKALRAQIDPHFLFNSLNSIAALISSDAPRARAMTVQLAEFFRASVAAGRQHMISLSEEMDLIRMYLDIETMRFGRRLQVTFDAPPEATSIRVPPLLLQPLVENAIKHGIAQILEGGTISLTVRTSGDIISIAVVNPVDPDRRAELLHGTGFGLQSVRDRLKALAPGRGYLDIRNDGGMFEATVSLPSTLS